MGAPLERTPEMSDRFSITQDQMNLYDEIGYNDEEVSFMEFDDADADGSGTDDTDEKEEENGQNVQFNVEWFGFKFPFFRDVSYQMLSIDQSRVIHHEIAVYYETNLKEEYDNPKS